MSLPSEQQVLQLFQGAVPPQYTMKRLIQHFAVAAEERPAFRDTIRALVARGRLTLLRGTRYTVPFRRDTRAGLVRRHTDGYGFVVAEEGAEDDIYLSRQAMQGVMHGDRVLVRLEPTAHQGERRSGRVLQVLERGQTAVVGRIEVYGKTCWVLPLDERLCPGIYVPPREQVRAKRGDIVVAEVSRYALAQEYPQGRIVEVLGHADDPDLEMRIILHTYELPTAFPPEVEAEAEAIPAAIAPEEWLRRRDLRRLLTCTIDGATARDFDDAVSLERLPNGHVRLGVHIADVSFYVQEDSAIDVEAAQRGTSVYFPDQVIPMLPGGLSHTLCCLQPDVDRLTLSVLLELTAEAQVVRYEIAETVIHSQARLTYTQVAAHLEGDSAALERQPPALGSMLHGLDALASTLRQQRLAAGSLDFDLPEAEMVLDAAGKIDTIVRAERTRAHMLIEECMLLANRTVAQHLAHLDVPALYRVHAAPSADKLTQLSEFVRTFGYTLPTAGPLSPEAVSQLLEAVQGTPEAPLINHLLLRSLPRAQYAAENTGHFGLACTYYTHFTSPIRRYPDLLVHRLWRDSARPGGMSIARRAWWQDSLPELAASTSRSEQRADEAERAVEQLKKVEFMLAKVGEAYAGVITSVTPFGFFVELESLFIEGLVHISSLSEYFLYFPEQRCLTGQRTGQRYRLGDRVQIQVEHVSLARKQIDFALCQPVPVTPVATAPQRGAAHGSKPTQQRKHRG